MQGHKSLTARQKDVLNFISSFMRKNGYAPSLKEIALFLKTSNLSTAQYFVEELKNKGYLKKESNIARGITPKTPKHSVPKLGYIAAGKPIDPIENPEEISVPESINIDSRYPHYALEVKGDSMIDMGILDGDTILVKHQLTANLGDVVVAITEDGATLKVLRRQNGQMVLEPRNTLYPVITPTQLEIRGKFVGLIRKSS